MRITSGLLTFQRLVVASMMMSAHLKTRTRSSAAFSRRKLFGLTAALLGLSRVTPAKAAPVAATITLEPGVSYVWMRGQLWVDPIKEAKA